MQESIQLVIDSAPYLLKGAVFTLQLSIGGMFFGLVLGFILALMRMSPLWPVKWLRRLAQKQPPLKECVTAHWSSGSAPTM